MVFSVMIINLLLGAFYVWWSAYTSHAQADRVTYTISDLITRQRGVTLNATFLDGLERTAEFILDPSQNAQIRFTQVTYRAGQLPTDPPQMTVDWSYSPCGAYPAAVAGPGFDVASLPEMAVGATMIVTDMRVPFVSRVPLIPSMTFERRAVALYRFERQFTLTGQGTTTCID